jgi:GNAT superfamily N-acetyltransferase
MPLNIRPAIFDDIPVLDRLIDASVRGLSKGYYTDSQIESSIKYIFGVDTQLLLDATYYVVEDDGRIAACGGWSKRKTLYGGDQHKSTADPLLNPAVDAARIRAFFVHPDFARQGIGRMLIRYCEHEAIKNGFSRMQLGATLPSEPLYAAMGYHAIQRELAQMPDGENIAIIKMQRELK